MLHKESNDSDKTYRPLKCDHSEEDSIHVTLVLEDHKVAKQCERSKNIF